VDDIIALTDVQPNDRSRVGGKAFPLGQLAHGGVPVPAGVVVTTQAFATALRGWGLWEEAERAQSDPSSARRMYKALRGCTPSDSLVQRLRRALVDIPGPFAVRSSGIDEDGQEHSFAGQHHTALGVAAPEVAQQVVACWASLYADEALAYRNGTGPTPASMGVVVQRMVQPAASGVLFTVNPLSGSWREMTVEAVYGLGEPLVSGAITPHWFLVRRPRRAPRPVQRVLSRVRLQVREQDLPPLRTQLRLGEDGPERVAVDPERQTRPVVDRRTLLRLCRMGLKVEGICGAPQDVEWAVDEQGDVFVLQSRPITRTATPRVRQDVLWTRRFIGERWPMPATTLGWSLMRPVLEHFIAYPRTQQRYLGGGPPLKLVRGRPYVNVTAFRHLVFKLPGSPPPRFMLELIPPEEEAEWQRRFVGMPDLSVYASYLRETLTEARWRRFAFNPLTNPREWERFSKRLQAALPSWSHEPVSVEDAMERVEAQQRWVQEYVGVHLCSLLFANLTYQLLDASLAQAAPERAAEWMRILAVCPPGNETLRTNAALWELSQQATPGQLDRLAAGRLPRGRFRDALDRFLDDFGHRSMASWELFTPRWGREPGQLVPMLRAFASGQLVDPRERVQEQEAAYVEARAELKHALDPSTRVWLLRLLDLTRAYLLLRENQRFAFDRLLASEHDTLRWLAERAVEAGWLGSTDDVALLTWEQLSGALSGRVDGAELTDIIERRRAQRDRDAEVMPPVFLSGDDEVAAAVSGRRLQGLGISGGRYTGPVAIVRSPAEADQVPEGAVLVAHAVDPGWTPLFGKVSAVVLELGSRLSHGAVVAREYGLPAVVNLDGITRVLRNGQQVTVDGTRGIVWVGDDDG